MKRTDGFLYFTPAAFLAFGLFLGIVLGTQIQIFRHSLPIFAVFAILLGLILTNRSSRILSAAIAVFVGVIFQNSWRAHLDYGENFFNDGDTVLISADFYSSPTFQSDREMTQSATVATKTESFWPLQFDGNYRISLIFPAEITSEILIPGERAKIKGVFRRFDSRNTAAPWEFDNIFQAQLRNTVGELEIISIEKEERLPLISKIYRHIRRNFEESAYNSLYISLFTGDRSFLTPQIRAFFRESGLVHFLAISGLHIAILVAALSMLVWILPLPKLWRRCAIALFILYLPFLVGFGPATLRAVIMGILLTVSPFFNRKSNSMNSLFAAAFFILAFFPMHIFLIGFQYSFIATFSVLLLPRLVGESKYKNEIIFLAMPVFLFLTTTPIQIFHFGTLTSISAPANLVMLPVLTIICQIALFSVFVSANPLFESVSRIMISFCDGALDILFFAINRTVLLSGMGEDYTQISPLVFVFISLCVIFLRLFPKRGLVYCSYLLLCLLTVLGIFNLFRKDVIYTVSSQNLRMKIYSGPNPTAIIIGDAQSRLFYNPKFLRWFNARMNRGLAVPLIITDSRNYYPNAPASNFITVKNATGEIGFKTEPSRDKTTAIAPAERRRRRTQTPRVFEKRTIPRPSG